MTASTDAAFMLQILNDAAFIRNVGDRGVRTEAEAANYLRERVLPSYERFGFGMWLVELRETGKAVGICGLIKRETLDDVDLGFSFAEEFRGQGLAYEASIAALDYGWKIVKLSRIVAITAPFNASSIRLLEKVGMRVEKKIKLEPNGPELMLFATEKT
jgi:RimJ/RimL family protein N-acetyltransferase